MIIIHFLLVIFLFILFSLTYLFIYYFYHFLIYLLIYLFMQLFNFKNFMFLQGNLPLEFKEGGTLLGRFWRGIWNWEDCFWLEDLKKEKRRRKEIGKFSFLETNLGLEGWYIYRWEKEKKRRGAARIGVLVGRRRKIAGKEIFFKKTFSTHWRKERKKEAYFGSR